MPAIDFGGRCGTVHSRSLYSFDGSAIIIGRFRSIIVIGRLLRKFLETSDERCYLTIAVAVSVRTLRS